METLRRTIHPEVRVIDERAGIVSYIASDETLDSYREIIRADGWRFDEFQKNAPFVDSHNYGTVENLLGRVIDFEVKGKQLSETVKWAIDVLDNKLAKLGFAMTSAGYLKAVSVGFVPTKMVSRWDRDLRPFEDACKEMDVDSGRVACIYLEQQQKELSACIIGANPNALAKAYKAGVINDEQLDLVAERFSTESSKRETVRAALESAAATLTRQRKRAAFLDRFEKALKGN